MLTPKQTVSKIFLKNLEKFCTFALIFLMLVIWQFNTYCIPVFLPVIFAMVSTLIFILFLALIFNMYIKLTCITQEYLSIFLMNFLSFFAYYLRFSFCHVWLFFFSGHYHCVCVFLLIFYVSCLFFTNSNEYNSSSGSVFVHINIDKDADCLQSYNMEDFSNDTWLLFSTLFFS